MQSGDVTDRCVGDVEMGELVEPVQMSFDTMPSVIGHIKNEHRMSRNYFAHQKGDAINAILAAAGYNFRRLLAG